MDIKTLRELQKSCRIMLPPDQEQRMLQQLAEIEQQLYHLPLGTELEAVSVQRFSDLRKDEVMAFEGQADSNLRRNKKGYFTVKGHRLD